MILIKVQQASGIILSPAPRRLFLYITILNGFTNFSFSKFIMVDPIIPSIILFFDAFSSYMFFCESLFIDITNWVLT